MGKDQCETCKFVGYCTFPKNRIITECDEYEHLDSAPAYNWDLMEFMKLWNETKEHPESRDN